MCSAPGIGSGRGFEPVAMTMWPASILRSPTRTAFGPAKAAWPRITSTPRSAMSGRAGRDVADHLLLAIDQRGPVEFRLADRDAVNVRPLDLVQRMARGHQHLFRRAAAVRAGAAQEIRFDHRHRQAGARVGTVTPMPALPPPRISTSYFSAHRISPSVGYPDAIRPRRSAACHLAEAGLRVTSS